MAGTLRSKESEAAYDAYQAQGGLGEGCALCKAEPIKQFTYWKITENRFPYDKIAQVHHTLVPLRHVHDDGLTSEERAEYQELKHGHINERYEIIIEAVPRKFSIPEHFHQHLVVIKED